MQVIFYKTTDDPRKMNKRLTKLFEQGQFHLKDNTSILTPTILVSRELIEGNVGNSNKFNQINYCHIPYFDRYYFVGNPVLQSGAIYEMPCTVDTLYTYRNHIGNIQTYIERQENVYNPYMQDSQLPCKVTRSVDKKIVGSMPVPDRNCYVLAVTNGEFKQGD